MPFFSRSTTAFPRIPPWGRDPQDHCDHDRTRHPRLGRRRGLSVWLISLLVLCLSGGGAAWGSELGDRLAAFPTWSDRPPVHPANGDLHYPTWFEGTWEVRTTLEDLAAPLAPDIISPGFESNRTYLHQPIDFQARFVPERRGSAGWLPIKLSGAPLLVADRAFNGANLAKAYLDDPTGAAKSPILAVKVDPENPNRQVTLLRGDRQLLSTVTARITETPSANEFLTCEISQQEFRSTGSIYFNQVETTTAYVWADDPQNPLADDDPRIMADQVTAIYLSPQDPDFFKAGDRTTPFLQASRPVALYRYHLEFRPVSPASRP